MRRGSDRHGDHAEELVLELVRQHAAELLRFAGRFSLCPDDAHDAYQRGLETLLRRMRSTPPEKPLPWLRTVIRHEALQVRAERGDLVGRKAPDFERYGGQLDDPADRVESFERLRHTAEALQRLKPQEISALVLRAEGRTYREIAEHNQWTYTKVNRAVTEGRRALLARLGAIESGAECDRWLPVLSALADGEATAAQLQDLRPHLRSCSACRATLRQFHRAPGEVAALVPLALVGVAGGSADVATRHAETLLHGLLERVTLAATRLQSAAVDAVPSAKVAALRLQSAAVDAVPSAKVAAMRLQGALDAVPGAKLAAIAASTAAIAGGGAAIEQASHAQARPAATVVVSDAATVPSAAALLGVLSPLRGHPSASSRSRDAGSVARSRAAGEFTFEAAHAGAGADAGAPPDAAAPTPRASASAFDPPAVSSSPASASPAAGHSPAAEFAGP